jgi:hypothetical protein
VTKHIVRFSGGAGSWAAAKRVAEQHGTADMTLLYADTRMEDEDLYRFLVQAASNVGAPLVCIADGRTPWEVFGDERFIGNSRVDPCSKILKRELLDKWCRENTDNADTVHYVGLDWTEQHRFFGQGKSRGFKRRMADAGLTAEAPMCERPYMSKEQMLTWMESEGIKRPRLYEMGFPHNNCGGFCVKAGHAHFKLLLQAMPERYRHHEEQEQRLREKLGRDDISILKDRRGGTTKPITLRQLRERIEGNEQMTFDEETEWGGCGCAIE